MIRPDQLPQMQSDIGDFVAQQPPQTQKRRRIAHDPLCFAHGPIPVRFLLLGQFGALNFRGRQRSGFGAEIHVIQRATCARKKSFGRKTLAPKHFR